MKTLLISTLASTMAWSSAFAVDTDHLVRLYEEEILAHDLYVELGKAHPEVRPFQNIPHSEARHREAMETILNKAGVPLPQPQKGKKFVTPGLDRTYRRWLKEGSQSPMEACQVGVRLEEHDIADLRKAAVDFPEHRMVLKQLEEASGNHLRAFHRNLTARDGTYEAEALKQAELQQLLNHEEPKAKGGCCGSCKGNSADNNTARPQGRMGNGGPQQRRRGQGGPNR